MTSLLSNTKQSTGDDGYYINVASLASQIHARTSEPSGNTGVGGGSFSTASWSFSLAGSPTSAVSSLVNIAGACVLKDLGRTVVSSLRTFRKVQLVLPANPSTFGVAGRTGSSGEDYFTGYIELGFEGNGRPAPVARFGR